MTKGDFKALFRETLERHGFIKEKDNFHLAMNFSTLSIYLHASNWGNYYNINYGISFARDGRESISLKEIDANLRWQFPITAEYENIDAARFVAEFERELKKVMPQPGQSEKSYLSSKLDLVGGDRPENIGFVMALPER